MSQLNFLHKIQTLENYGNCSPNASKNQPVWAAYCGIIALYILKHFSEKGLLRLYAAHSFCLIKYLFCIHGYDNLVFITGMSKVAL